MNSQASTQQNQLESSSLLQKYQSYLQGQSGDSDLQILVHQRIVYQLSHKMEKITSQRDQYNLLYELTAFINRINVKVMRTGQLDAETKIHLIGKCIDMLFFKSICKTVRPVEKLLQLRVLTFNNLSCIYKEQRQYENALSSVELALQIEDYLLSKNYVHTHKSIASTYLNKCVILSAIGNHEEALMAGKCSLKNIENYRHAFLDQLKEKDQKELKQIIMLANYNIAVENEHLGKQEAIFYYETALSLAKQFQNQEMIAQIFIALKKVKQTAK